MEELVKNQPQAGRVAEDMVPEDMLLRYMTVEERDMAVKAGFSARTGLRWTLEELSRIKVDPRRKGMADMACYVDAITYTKVRQNDTAFFESMLGPTPSLLEGRISATGLGNIAYVATQMRDSTTRERAASLYKEILSSMISEN